MGPEPSGEGTGAAPGRSGSAVASTLAAVAAFGPYFAFETHPADSPVMPPWRPMDELVRDPAALLARVEAVRAALATAGGQPVEAVELRVAGSVAQLGLVARLVSPALAVAARYGTALFEPEPRLGAPGLRWQPVLGGGFPLSVPERAVLRARGAAPAAGSEELAGWLGAGLLDGPVRALVQAFEGLSISPRVLWGNVASAVVGAAAVVSRSATPEVGVRARALAGSLLEQSALLGAGTFGVDGFRRHSCCLIYRAAPDRAGPLCGDCVLTGRQ